MIKVEYLVLVDNENIKCSDVKTFNHLLQSDPDITISKSTLFFKKTSVAYEIKSGRVINTNKDYFHILFSTSIDNIDEFILLQKSIKSLLHLINKAPQILYDGVSLHYSQLAYPLIFEIENLMRKLITKFMLTNIGVNWTQDRVPDDVKKSIKSENRDITYLHNVDFIQLKFFLFSESYLVHKDTLINKMKNAKDINELKLDEIKALIPTSNWEKYFSDKVHISKEKLSKKWDELYELRCKVAHNRIFTKGDFGNVEKLAIELKQVIIEAIENLDNIDISELEQEEVTEQVAGNFNYLYGDFIAIWRELEQLIIELADKKFLPYSSTVLGKQRGRSFQKDLMNLFKMGVINEQIFGEIMHSTNVRNQIVHNISNITEPEIIICSENTKLIINHLNEIISD